MKYYQRGFYFTVVLFIDLLGSFNPCFIKICTTVMNIKSLNLNCKKGVLELYMCEVINNHICAF